jgi:hypothetical protein
MTAPELVELDTVSGLGVTGQGEPGGPEYGQACQALYAVAGQLAASMPVLEGRWWVEDDRSPFEVPRAEWRWHLFLPLPEGIEPGSVDQARESVRESVPAAARVQLVTFTEGRCVQVVHEGPYSDEPRALATMDRFMAEAGLVRNGLHHEVYLTDFRQTPPEQARTILRQPVREAHPG